jgi:DNA polymerase-1
MSIFFLDIETTGLDPFTCDLVTLQIMKPNGKAKICKDPDNLIDIKRLLENNLIVGHNIKFDSKFLKYRYGITLKNVYDTYIAEIAISGGLLAGRKGASLKDLVFKYCGIVLDKTEQCGFKKGVALTESQENYAVSDLKYLPEIMKQQQAQIKTLKLESIINTEMRALPAVVWLELSGMNIDINKVQEIKAKLEAQKAEAQAELYKTFSITGKKSQMSLDGTPACTPINLNSTQQLIKALNGIGIPAKSTNEKELSKFNHPIIKVLKTYKEAEKLLNTFVNKMPDYINPVTGRVHSNFNQYGAKSGRFTSSSPNLQQQPSKFGEWRSIYTAPPGTKIITADYSQIELRILGQVANEPEYINAYSSGEDLHKLTASKIFKIPLDEVQKKQRSIAKTVNFGIAYGMWSQGLQKKLQSAGIEITVDEAEQIIRGYYKSYPMVTAYLNNVSEEGLKNLEIRNKAGRLMKFNPPADEREKGSIKRESKNLPIQSLCADMIKVAMANIFNAVDTDKVKFINTVHDELVFQCPEELAEEVAQVVKEEMEKAGKVYLKDMPCVAEVTIGNMWEK